MSFWEFLTSLSEATMLERRSCLQSPLKGVLSGWRPDSVTVTSNSLIHVFVDLDSCNVAQSFWNRKGSSANSVLKLGPWHCPNRCAEALRVPFTGSKGPNPDCQKVWFFTSSSGVLYTTASLVFQWTWMQLIGHWNPIPEALYALPLS